MKKSKSPYGNLVKFYLFIFLLFSARRTYNTFRFSQANLSTVKNTFWELNVKTIRKHNLNSLLDKCLSLFMVIGKLIKGISGQWLTLISSRHVNRWPKIDSDHLRIGTNGQRRCPVSVGNFPEFWSFLSIIPVKIFSFIPNVSPRNNGSIRLLLLHDFANS